MSIRKYRNKKGQASTELAVMGSVLIMLLAYLVQQGFLYNNRQALEMYTFRKALELSRDQERGIALTVSRDVIIPSFFSGLSRSRIQAIGIVECNPWMQYTAYAEDPEHVPSLQLLQIGEVMIRKRLYFQVPPTKVKVDYVDSEDDGETPEFMWVSSSPQEGYALATKEHSYVTEISEDSAGKSVRKTLQRKETIPQTFIFSTKEEIEKSYIDDDWEGILVNVEVDPNSIPKNLTLVQEETVERKKDVSTPH